MKESDVVASICDYLAARRHFFYRSNNIPVYDKARGAFRALPKYTPRGVPDIIVVKDGRFIGIEVKTDTGRLSPDQVEFGRQCNEHGGTYAVARSIDDVQRLGL